MGGTGFTGTLHHPFTTALPYTKLAQKIFFSSGGKKSRTEILGVVEAIPRSKPGIAYGACLKPCSLPTTAPECQDFPMPLCGVFMQKCRR